MDLSISAFQTLFGDEVFPEGSSSGKFDASLEEILHLITEYGYSQEYDSVFGEKIGSEIANAMDTARGGQFTSIPSSYPSDTWYHYTDSSCDYKCQITEYFYWGLTSILNGQEHSGRFDEIKDDILTQIDYVVSMHLLAHDKDCVSEH